MRLEPGLLIAGLLLLGSAAQWLAWRFKLPAILFLLLLGLLLGPLTGAFDPDAMFGELLLPFVSLAVAVILFEGSLTLRFGEIRGLGPAILRLISIGAAVTVAILSWAGHVLAGLDWPIALLFGAVVSVTGPTVIVPMLRSVRPNERISNILRWEGIIIDPLGALLAVLMFELIVSGESSGESHHWLVFGQTVVVGAACGYGAARLLGYALRRHLVPEYLQNLGALTLVLASFAVANAIRDESGLLAVTVMGIVLANQKGLQMDDILDFKEHLSTLLITLLFIVLAARLAGPIPLITVAGGIGVLLVAQLVARPAAVLASTLFSSVTWRERALLAWIAPRGIVAAAVSALFALRLQQLGVPGGDKLVPLTFLMIIGTVLIQSASAGRLARWLKVADPDPNGVLIIGSDRLARTVAKALADLKLPVVIADEDWAGIREARMRGMRTFFGNPVSEHADRNLDLVGIGRLLALSTRRELNSLACVRYRPEFGANRVVTLRLLPSEGGEGSRTDFAQQLAAPQLLGEQVTRAQLEALLNKGWRLKATKLSEDFGYEEFLAKRGEGVLVPFALNERGQLRVATDSYLIEPKPGWTVVAFVPPEENAA
ncbi:MAG TPA: cation:proton antiporter [Burkholderiales bacterium]|nr:cation:proton antiporter [Burkholderiales bacterium]